MNGSVKSLYVFSILDDQASVCETKWASKNQKKIFNFEDEKMRNTAKQKERNRNIILYVQKEFPSFDHSKNHNNKLLKWKFGKYTRNQSENEKKNRNDTIFSYNININNNNNKINK